MTVTGVDDDTEVDRSTSIRHTARGSGYRRVSIPDVAVTVTDDDEAGVTFSTSSVTVTEASGAGNTATYTVVLDYQPTGKVIITLSVARRAWPRSRRPS